MYTCNKYSKTLQHGFHILRKQNKSWCLVLQKLSGFEKPLFLVCESLLLVKYNCFTVSVSVYMRSFYYYFNVRLLVNPVDGELVRSASSASQCTQMHMSSSSVDLVECIFSSNHLDRHHPGFAVNCKPRVTSVSVRVWVHVYGMYGALTRP